MSLSLDDFEQNQELMDAGEELAKELKVLLKQKYPDIDKIRQYRHILGTLMGSLEKSIATEALINKINGLLSNSEFSIDMHDFSQRLIRIYGVADEIYVLIKDSCGSDTEKLRTYVSVLSDFDGNNEFYFELLERN